MARIKPLEALHYAPRLLEDAASLLSPPYDVIDEELQERLYEVSPWNAVRLELPREQEPYAAAAARISSWSGAGVLERDRRGAYYALQQEFVGPDGRRRLRTGFFAALRLSPPSEGAVLPHERTLSGPRADRMRLFRETRTNISPIFGVYADPERRIDTLLEGCCTAEKPFVEATFQGVSHRLWRIVEPAVLARMSDLLAGATIYIADGHHRYATGLDYRDERAAADPSHTGEEPWNYILAYLSNIHDEGLAIFPIHRLLHGLEGFEPERFLSSLAAEFEVVGFDAVEPMKRWLEESSSSYAFGVVMPGGFFGALLRGDPEALPGMPDLPALRRLPLVVLHERIFSRLLGIGQEALAAQRNVRYLKDDRRLVEAVAAGEGQLGFLVKPTTVRQVLDVAASGEVMPQKSTFFYPKVPTGLLFHPLD